MESGEIVVRRRKEGRKEVKKVKEEGSIPYFVQERERERERKKERKIGS